MHGRGDGCLELRCFQVLRCSGQSFFGQGQNLGVCFGQRCWNGYFAKVLIRHGDSAVDQVAPAIGKLVINAANKLVPSEVGISVFWSSYRNEIAQCIRAELLEEVLDVDNNALGRGELGAGHGQELRGNNFRRQVELTVFVQLASLCALAGVAQQFCWPNLGVEGDVVLAHEVVVANLWVLPEILPRVWVAAAVGPLDGRRKVANNRVEPDVELLSVIVFPTLDWNGDAPVNIARHRAWAHVLDEVEGELQRIRTPVLTSLQPLRQNICQSGQIEQEVLGLHEFGSFAIDLGYGIDQVNGIKLVAAVIALITACAIRVADWAFAFDVA